MKKLFISLFACVCMLSLSTTVKAIPLGVGGAVNSTGAGSPGGALVNSVVNVPFTANTGLFSGWLSQWVRSNANGLVFEYQYHNNQASADPTHRVTTIDFTGFTTSVDITGMAGVNIARNTASTVAFDIGLLAGATSPLFWIQTNAHQYKSGVTNIIDGGIAAVKTYAPAVPEPGTMFLLGSLASGLFGFAGLKKRFTK